MVIWTPGPISSGWPASNRAFGSTPRSFTTSAGTRPVMAVADLQKNPDFAPLLDTHIKKGLEYGNTPLAART